MISISFDQVESPELTRRRLTISDQSGAPLSQIDFDLLGAGPAQRPQNFDGFMGAVIQYAMFVRQPLAIKGRLSRQCLHNIAEFQSLIASYYPQMFRVIDVLPDDVDEGAPAKDAMRAISLFSGGVDSVFTLLRHQGKACPGGLSIKNVALIHHQYLEDPDSYVKKRLERFAPLLESLGVAITVQRTNLRQAMVKLGLKYVPTHGGQLSASLQQYAHCFEIGLFASTAPARAPVLPYGSTPAADMLFSTPQMQIFHDGSGYARQEKVEFIAQNPLAVRTLHVCLKHPYENCGVCAKCVRTHLNFLALGADRPECMPGPLDLSLFDRSTFSGNDLNELELILQHVERHGATGPWRQRLEKKVRARGRRGLMARLGGRARMLK